MRGYSLGKLVGKTCNRLLNSDIKTMLELKIVPVAGDMPRFCIERNLGEAKSRGRLYIVANHLLPTIENTMLTTAILDAEAASGY